MGVPPDGPFVIRPRKHVTAFRTAVLSVLLFRISSIDLATRFGRGCGSLTTNMLTDRRVVDKMVLTISEQAVKRPGKCVRISALFDHLLDNFTKHLMLSFIKRNKRQHPW